MTIDYRLYLSNEAAAAEPTSILRSEFNLGKGEDEVIRDTLVSWVPHGPVSIKSRRLDEQSAGMAKEFGLDAKLSVGFQLIVEELDEAKKIMIRDLSVLLSKMDGDAVFFDLGDQVIIRRKNGRLEVNEQADFWTPELRALVPSP